MVTISTEIRYPADILLLTGTTVPLLASQIVPRLGYDPGTVGALSSILGVLLMFAGIAFLVRGDE